MEKNDEEVKKMATITAAGAAIVWWNRKCDDVFATWSSNHEETPMVQRSEWIDLLQSC